MFTLLVGCPPFWHRKQMVMLRNIMEGKYSFTSPEWAEISGKSATLILNCDAYFSLKKHVWKKYLGYNFVAHWFALYKWMRFI